MKLFILSQQVSIIKLAVEKPVTGRCTNQQIGMQKSFSKWPVDKIAHIVGLYKCIICLKSYVQRYTALIHLRIIMDKWI